MKFKERLKFLRNTSGYTQIELAEELHISRQAIAKWETGRGLPDIENLTNISRLFNISLDQLILEDESISKKVVSDAKSKKWHLLVILYLVSIIIYIIHFYFYNRILILGFGISTLFMLGTIL